MVLNVNCDWLKVATCDFVIVIIFSQAFQNESQSSSKIDVYFGITFSAKKQRRKLIQRVWKHALDPFTNIFSFDKGG